MDIFEIGTILTIRLKFEEFLNIFNNFFFSIFVVY